MELRDSHNGRSAWTMIEVVMVTVSLAILLPLLVGAVANAKQQAHRVTFAAEQEPINLADALWFQDHLGKYPFAVSGAMGSMNTTEAWRTFQVLPSQSASTQVPICPPNDSDWVVRFRETGLATNRLAIP